MWTHGIFVYFSKKSFTNLAFSNRFRFAVNTSPAAKNRRSTNKDYEIWTLNFLNSFPTFG